MFLSFNQSSLHLFFINSNQSRHFSFLFHFREMTRMQMFFLCFTSLCLEYYGMCMYSMAVTRNLTHARKHITASWEFKQKLLACTLFGVMCSAGPKLVWTASKPGLVYPKRVYSNILCKVANDNFYKCIYLRVYK